MDGIDIINLVVNGGTVAILLFIGLRVESAYNKLLDNYMKLVQSLVQSEMIRVSDLPRDIRQRLDDME